MNDLSFEALVREINHLAKKKKIEGLTPQEQELQQAYRTEYIHRMKHSLRGHIEGLKIVDESGNDITPQKLKDIQKEKQIHGRDKEH